ncbi:hypothetical protein L9F63_028127, partial [Diploptera punctata]
YPFYFMAVMVSWLEIRLARQSCVITFAKTEGTLAIANNIYKPIFILSMLYFCLIWSWLLKNAR